MTACVWISVNHYVHSPALINDKFFVARGIAAQNATSGLWAFYIGLSPRSENYLHSTPPASKTMIPIVNSVAPRGGNFVGPRKESALMNIMS